jgi:hypothetical protein
MWRARAGHRPARVARPIVRQVFTTFALVSALPMTVFYTTMTLYGLRAAALVTVSFTTARCC